MQDEAAFVAEMKRQGAVAKMASAKKLGDRYVSELTHSELSALVTGAVFKSLFAFWLLLALLGALLVVMR